MNYINYFIKCIIRRLSYLICKPKVLLTILAIIVVLFLFTNSSKATYNGDETYTDPNATILSAYDTIANDLINRLSNSTSFTSDLLEFLRSADYNFYLYYGSPDGLMLINGSTWATNRLYIAFFSSSNPSVSFSTYNSYQGIDCTVVYARPTMVYCFTGNSLSTASLTNVYFPDFLLTYKPQNLINYINNNSEQFKNDIVQAIEDQTEAITDAITSTDYDEDTVNINTSSSDAVDSSSTSDVFSSLFNNFSNLLQNESWDSVSTITINLPFVPSGRGIVLRSDMLKNILGNTLLTTLVNVAWYSLFGLYIFKFVNKIYHSIKSGDILNGINLDDEVITSTML